jgi:putative acetyltransferase
MKIREATPADFDAIRSLVSDSLAEFGFLVEPAGIDADLDDIGGAYQHSGGSFRVLVDESDTVLGCGGIYPVDDRTAELRKMYLRPAVRGRGFGRTLLADLVDAAKSAGFERMVLETASNLTAAIRLYEQFGFAATEGQTHACRCDRAFSLNL